MDTRIVYTASREGFWEALAEAAGHRGATVHGGPPEVAVEVGPARLYIVETSPGDVIPPMASHLLGPEVVEFVIDIHDAVAGEAFLADVVEYLDAVVDDDQGDVSTASVYAGRVRGRSGPQ